MTITNHKFEEFWHEESSDIGGDLSSPRFLVMHYTAGGSGSATRDYLLRSAEVKGQNGKKVFASAHLVVGRGGEAWQIVPFDRIAHHAGRSRWKGLSSLNRHSIGIEIANYGFLHRRADGAFQRPGTPVFPPSEVVVASHGPGERELGWEVYPDAQVLRVEALARELLAAYPSIVEIVGHDEIAPGRKLDPGPAFPMQRFRQLVDDRGAGAKRGDLAGELMAVTTRLNVRGGPGTDFERLHFGPLETGTELCVLDEEGSWRHVVLTDGSGRVGWVHGSFLRLV